MLQFVTGNQDKIKEARSILDRKIKQLDIDLPEIQEMNIEKIIEYKLDKALKQVEGDLIVEDTGLYFEGMDGFPGPLVKWAFKKLGNEGLAQMVQNFENHNAKAVCCIGYASSGVYRFVKGQVSGKIVRPKGNGFGWDGIFQPNDSDLIFAQMSLEQKNKYSMRKKAFEKLKVDIL